MNKIIIILSIVLVIYSCKKSYTCQPTINSSVGFEICENLVDTILPTDTTYSNRPVYFQANNYNDSISFKIGNDPRVFTKPLISLIFSSPQTIDVNYTANFFDGCKMEKSTIAKKLTLIKKDTSHISPLVGTYLGYNTDNSNDTFSVSIKFWYGAKYAFWPNGAYTVDNLPRGYRDTTKEINGVNCKEITGIQSSTGYKNISINESNSVLTQGIKGCGSLKRGFKDTLIFTYTLMDTHYIPNQPIRYYKKQFIGIKK